MKIIQDYANEDEATLAMSFATTLTMPFAMPGIGYGYTIGASIDNTIAYCLDHCLYQKFEHFNSIPIFVQSGE